MKTVFVALVFASHAAIASPEVIADFGGRDSGYRDISALVARANAEAVPAAVPTQAHRFPIVSSLTVGRVENRTHNKAIEQPVFIFGADNDSLRWVAENADYLNSLDATGFLTNVQTSEDMHRIQQMFPALRILSIPVARIALALELTHYPVLINKEEIQQ